MCTSFQREGERSEIHKVWWGCPSHDAWATCCPPVGLLWCMGLSLYFPKYMLNLCPNLVHFQPTQFIFYFNWACKRGWTSCILVDKTTLYLSYWSWQRSSYIWLLCAKHTYLQPHNFALNLKIKSFWNQCQWALLSSQNSSLSLASSETWQKNCWNYKWAVLVLVFQTLF